MINQYIVERTLGVGSYAVVKLCKDKNTGLKYAIKQMNRKKLQLVDMGGGKNAYQSVVEELKVLQTLSHPNIIWLNEIIDDPKKDDIYLVTEWLSKGSLHDLVEERNQGRTTRIGLPISVVRTYLSDMIKALDYCHNVAGVFHRDIKPENIMLNHNDEAILIDFGVSALKKGNDAVLKNKNWAGN